MAVMKARSRLMVTGRRPRICAGDAASLPEPSAATRRPRLAGGAQGFGHRFPLLRVGRSGEIHDAEFPDFACHLKSVNAGQPKVGDDHMPAMRPYGFDSVFPVRRG